MQPECAFAVDKVSRVYRKTSVFFRVFRNGKTDNQPITGAGSKINFLVAPIHFEGVKKEYLQVLRDVSV
jgi:hypothetical protein